MEWSFNKPRKESILWLKCVNLPWWKWPLARTSTISPGRDNTVHIVELETVCARSTSMENVLAWKGRLHSLPIFPFLGRVTVSTKQ